MFYYNFLKQEVGILKEIGLSAGLKDYISRSMYPLDSK